MLNEYNESPKFVRYTVKRNKENIKTNYCQNNNEKM